MWRWRFPFLRELSGQTTAWDQWACAARKQRHVCVYADLPVVSLKNDELATDTDGLADIGERAGWIGFAITDCSLHARRQIAQQQ
jgi:hypothetical protein